MDAFIFILFQNTLESSQTKKNTLMSKGRRFDKVEQNMNHIQASLSRTSLIAPETNNERNLDDRMVTRLKRELEDGLRFYLIKTRISTLTNRLILLPADLLGTVALLIPGLQDIRGMFSSWLPSFLNMVINKRSFLNYTTSSSIGSDPNILFYPLLDTRFKDQGLFLLSNI